MADVTFQQDRQLASERFVLQERTLLITGGAPPRRSIPLESISPDYVRIERRFRRGYLVPLFLAGVCAVVAWRLFQGDPSPMRVTIAGIAAFQALIFPFLMKFDPVEGARFLDRRGVPVFEIYRPLKSAYTYDEFLSALVERVNERTRA
jgi:hypothetical protein